MIEGEKFWGIMVLSVLYLLYAQIIIIFQKIKMKSLSNSVPNITPLRVEFKFALIYVMKCPNWRRTCKNWLNTHMLVIASLGETKVV